jgi:glucose/arabinose dehydrogenase
LKAPRDTPRKQCVAWLASLVLALAAADAAAGCAPDNGGLILPAGFCASVFADLLGQARHLAVAPDGAVYVNTWRSPYRKDAQIPAGGFLVGLRDKDGDGVAETIERYPLVSGRVAPPQGEPETIVAGLSERCEELDTAAGMWRYEAGEIGQLFTREQRHASGLRNSVAMAIHPTSALFVVQHGRDQLHENWPKRFSAQQGAELPAENLFRVERGADYGWPYCYYDGQRAAHVLAPEYGGDGRRIGRCAGRPMPVASFPAHWAPNALVPLDAAGNSSGNFEVFADGFAGVKRLKDPKQAAHRPSGLAVGPDGALYISDDQGGRIWKITRR